METEHIPLAMARAYLLGALPDDAAAAVEESYFLSPGRLDAMRAAERRLIEDYLAGALGPDDLLQFEARYLRTPALKTLVDRARRERAGADRWRAARLAWAAAAVCLAGVCLWMFLGRREAAPARTTARTVAGSPQLLAAITLRLSPGMSKDAGARAARMPLPPDGAPVRLVAELPGLAAPAECTARLYLPGADGTWTKVWNSGPARTAAEGHTQELTVVLPPATLHSGDYVLEAAAPDGRVRERYVFRVSPAE